MRKLVLLLLIALLPLHWSSAAVAALCLPGAAGHPHVALSLHAHSHGEHLHAAHGEAAHGEAAQGEVAGAGTVDANAVDAGGCCHAAASVLPTRHALRLAPPPPPGPLPQAALPVPSFLPDGLFRPPRDRLA